MARRTVRDADYSLRSAVIDVVASPIVCEADPYGDRDLVVLYDVDNPGGADHDFYRGLAEEVDARRIVDLGCGTGLLTRTLATAGRQVVGVDPSSTMLEHARSRPGAANVTWLLGDAAALPADAGADLIVCTGNAIMHVGPDELPATLAAVAATLHAGGVFGFETRNPAFREWELWSRDATYSERTTHLGVLREWLDVRCSGHGRVVFDAHNLLPSGEDRVYTSVLHFHTLGDILRQLGEAGFRRVQVAGGWHGEPVTDNARVLVFRAERA